MREEDSIELSGRLERGSSGILVRKREPIMS